MQAKSSFNHLITICVFSTLSVTALAQEDEAEESVDLSPTPLMKQAASVDDIARQLADPNSVLGTLNFNLDYFTYKGCLLYTSPSPRDARKYLV